MLPELSLGTPKVEFKFMKFMEILLFTKKLAATMGEELTIQELMDLRVILIRFMADKEAHKKIPRLESRAPKLWDKVDRMYKYKQKENEDRI